MLTKQRRRYRCSHCGKVVMRISAKRRIKSYCYETGRFVHLTVVNSRRRRDRAGLLGRLKLVWCRVGNPARREF